MSSHTPAGHSGSEPRRATGFTLVELLVVMGVIGVLAALLLPVVNHAKDHARRVTDINNLKQVTTATHLYTSDNRDILPWCNWGIPLDRPGWLYTTHPSDAGANRFRVETGLFWPTLQNARLYRCPQDAPAHPMFQYRAQQSSSYVMNGAVCGYNRERYPSLRLEEFEPDAVILWETDEQEPAFFNDGASRPEEGVSLRHDAGALCATFGGAVSYSRFVNWYRDVACTDRSRLWCYPDSPDGR